MKRFVLNQSTEGAGLAKNRDISKQLKSRMDNLKLNFFDLEKGRVNYDEMRNSDDFQAYKEAAKGLIRLDLTALSTREAKLAFWINIYNALVVHGVLELAIKKSVKEVSSFFEAVSYDIGGLIFSLDDIEHGILRANKKKHLLSRKPFSDDDPRRKFVVAQVDPRIHFALVCGCSSCPPIEVYDEKEIDEQLDLVATGFINSDEASIEKDSKKLRLSKIFRWYQDDFGGKEGVLAFVTRYRYDPEDKDFLKKNADKLRIVYNDYNWALNIV